MILPIGRESVFAFATRDAVSPAELGLYTLGERYAVIDPVVGPDFARCLQTHLGESGERSAFARLDYMVEPDARELPYTVASIEDYFGTTTRSIRRPTLDLVIQFDSGSSELGKEALVQLDEVGKALAGSKLAEFTFQLDGHTDDIGADGYNDNLSQRRADAARRYLLARHGVDPTHLMAVGHGVHRPKMAGTNKDARDQNRRVERELKSRGTRGGPIAPNYRCAK